MSNLIRINENGKVTARELYDFLELRAGDFARWCRSNIVENQFASENTDWVRLRIGAETPTGGKIEREDFEISLDFAKKLCMVSKSERGEQARNYFIEVEKRFKKMTTEKPVSLQKNPRRRSYMIKTAVNDIDATAKAISRTFGVMPELALSVAFSAVEKNYEMDLTPIKPLIPAVKHDIGWMKPTALGERLGNVKAAEVNRLLERIGFQKESRDHKKRLTWLITEEGKEWGEIIPATNNTNGYCGYQIKWREKVLPLLEEAMEDNEQIKVGQATAHTPQQ